MLFKQSIKILKIFLLFCSLIKFLACSIDNISNLTLECEKGKMTACNDLATAKFKKNKISEALELYRKACEENNLNSCTNLGILEYKAGNSTYAKEIFTKACELGNTDSCNNMKRITNPGK